MLSSDEVATISRAVALEHGRELDVRAAAVTDGGSGRVEILVTVGGCHKDPCRFLVSVSRSDRTEFETDFRAKLSEAIGRHLKAAE